MPKKLTGKALEKELREVVKICRKIEKTKISAAGHGLYYPPKGEKYLYDELVIRGVMKISPLDSKGYMFTEAEDLFTTKNPKGGSRTIGPEDIAKVPKKRAKATKKKKKKVTKKKATKRKKK